MFPPEGIAVEMSDPGRTTAPAATTTVVPAQLGFLAIYNPSLGTTDETMEDQIVYYSSVLHPSSSSRKQRRSGGATTTAEQPDGGREDRNERLRQIGLAQGMVEFGRSFSGDRPVDTVETEKSRVVLHELEPGWWILASVDLTKLPLPPPPKGAGGTEPPPSAVEYSSREVKPAALLLQDLLRAHSVFLLHHDSSLSALFVRSTNRQRFTTVLARFWDIFLASWNVMLHGNPLRNVFGGIKIAACGELGFGVGEEERGSGEREVLEGLVGRIDGLVDLVVGKFGEADDGDGDGDGDHGRSKSGAPDQWPGTGSEPGAEDGVIFLGVGALSRHSLRDLAFWMEDLYTWGENAYGVKESPTAGRPRPNLRRKKLSAKATAPAAPAPPTQASGARAQPPEPAGPGDFGPPPPIVKPAAQTAAKPAGHDDDKEAGGVEKMMGYLKLGYGTYWSLGSSPAPDEAAGSEPPKVPADPPSSRPSVSRTTSADETAGHYLIGLMGDVEEQHGATDDGPEEAGYNSRTLLRTLTVELESEGTGKPEAQMSHDLGSSDTELAPQTAKSPASSSRTVKRPSSGRPNSASTPSTALEGGGGVRSSSSSKTSNSQTSPRDAGAQNHHGQTAFDSQDRNKTKKVRVVVYANKPFVFAFLFDLRTDSLNWDAAYRSLHHQLAPLRKPLLASTAYRPGRPAAAAAGGAGAGGGGQKIYDLVWDPRSLTVHSTVPSIPTGVGVQREEDEAWTRVEALNTHVQLLNTHASTRGGGGGGEMELERTAKTSRGWWIVWSRVLEREAAAGSASAAAGHGAASGSGGEADEEQGDGGESGGSGRSTDDEITPTQEGAAVVGKEIFLIRKSGDHSGGAGGVRSLVSAGVSGGGGGWADGASRLAQGIGVDTRKYIEGLLSLNR